LNVGAPDADGRGAQRFVFVLFAAQQCSHRASQPLGIERLDEETLAPLRRAKKTSGRRSSNINTATGSAAP